MMELFSCGVPKVASACDVFDNLAFRISLIEKEIGKWDSWGSSLASIQCLASLLVFVTLLLLLLITFWG